MRIDQRALANVGANIDEHRRHANHAPRAVTAVATAGDAGNDAHAVRGCERADWISGLIEEGLLRRVDGHVRDGAHSKTEEDSLLHPGVGAPAGFRGGVGFSSVNFAAIERRFEISKQPLMFFFELNWSFVK